MGNSRGVFLGPYIQFKQEVVTKTISEDGCPKCKKSCSKFCENCGSPKGKYSTQVKTNKVQPWQLVEDLKIVDEFWTQEVGDSDVWLPNKKLVGVSRSFSLEDSDDHCMDFLGQGAPLIKTPVYEVAAFQQRYEKHFSKLEAAYCQAVFVKWGIVVWSEY